MAGSRPRASAPNARGWQPNTAAQASEPSGPEPAPAPIAHAQGVPISPTAPPRQDEPAAPTALAADRADPQQSARLSEPEPAADLSQFTREDRRMMEKIRAAVPGGLSDEHTASAMLAAKRNGIQDADRLGPVAVVGDTLWMDRTIPGFHTTVDVAQQAPPLQDTLRNTQQFNQDQAQKQAQAREPEQQQQNERQTNAMRPQL